MAVEQFERSVKSQAELVLVPTGGGVRRGKNPRSRSSLCHLPRRGVTREAPPCADERDYCGLGTREWTRPPSRRLSAF